ncbi:MAG: cbb3-type cytochrome c oxidase subunit I [Candidatus Hydrogenedentes bacterium]|nr:cbb3-type cytochrome c oxidase subunit I [Candidatus Hydrogenedentota bacterium]
MFEVQTTQRRDAAYGRWWSWPFSTDHKTIALLYALSALSMLLLAFLFMVAMRWQLAYPGKALPLAKHLFSENHPWLPNGVMLPDFYNQLGAMHGTLMIFIAVVPLVVGALGGYLVPLMIGAPNMAFPRLNLLGLWAYWAGTLTLLASFFAPGGPTNSGWTGYPPLAVVEHAGQTYWLLGLAFIYVSNLLLSINIIVTIVQSRTVGMTFLRLPYFVWTQLVTAFLLLLAFPPLAAAAVLMLMDRLRGTSFFLPSGLVVSDKVLQVSGGGSALLWQHLFWFLAHPEVYVLVLPAFGILAEIITNNTRKSLWGYRGMVGAAIFMAFISMLVWAHHMYLTGMGTVLSSFFQMTTVIVSIPSLIIASALLVSLWGGSIRFTPPMMYALAFLPMFGIGGFTGLPLALAASDIALHDTYYVIGHFHYIVAPGTLFAIFAAIYHWYPKVTGRLMNERLAHLHFWPTLLFMNVIFMAMLFQGLAGVSRRLYDGGMSYAHGQEVFFLNKAASHSAFALAVVQLVFIYNFFRSLRHGQKAPENPWHATTLEWFAPTPPLRDGNFAEPPKAFRGPNEYSVPGALEDFTPQWKDVAGASSPARGAVGSTGGNVEAPETGQDTPATEPRLDTGLYNGKLGMWLFLAAETMFFGALYSSYVFLRTASDDWPAGAQALPLGYSFFSLLVLLGAAACSAQTWAVLRVDQGGKPWGWLGGVVACGAIAVLLIAMEHSAVASRGINAATSNFYGMYYLLSGLQRFHVLAGVLLSFYYLVSGQRKLFRDAAAYMNRLECLGLYWQFLAVMWVVFMTMVYLF